VALDSGHPGGRQAGRLRAHQRQASRSATRCYNVDGASQAPQRPPRCLQCRGPRTPEGALHSSGRASCRRRSRLGPRSTDASAAHYADEPRCAMAANWLAHGPAPRDDREGAPRKVAAIAPLPRHIGSAPSCPCTTPTPSSCSTPPRGRAPTENPHDVAVRAPEIHAPVVAARPRQSARPQTGPARAPRRTPLSQSTPTPTPSGRTRRCRALVFRAQAARAPIQTSSPRPRVPRRPYAWSRGSGTHTDNPRATDDEEPP